MPNVPEYLINPKLAKALQPAPLSTGHLAILQAWQDSIHNQAIFKQTETALHSQFIQKILVEILGYKGFDGTSWTLAQEQKIGNGSVDIALGHFAPDSTKIIAPFELKGARTKDLDAIMPGRHKSPVQQAWEYAMDAPGAQWVLVSNYLEIRLYAVGYGRQAYESWDLSKLTDPLEYTRLQWLVSAKQLLSGASLQILKQSEQLGKEITNQLYRDYKALREKLFNTLNTANPTIAPLDLIRHVQTILDRILFIVFAEDRKLLPNQTIAQAYKHHDPYYPRPVWDNFKALFRAIDSGNPALNIPAYNGGLFKSDTQLDRLIVSDALCEEFKNLAEYNFASEVSVTVLGHIFEQSISDIESLQAKFLGEANQTASQTISKVSKTVSKPASKTVSKVKKHGVVYTPDHITRFIVEHTLGGHLRTGFAALWNSMANKRKKDGAWMKKGNPELQFWRSYQQILRTTRVLDPACGSGAFLVAAFDFFHAEYTRVNDVLESLSGSYDLFDLDKEILNRNLYGVDLNPESIEITKLSLWLKTAKHGKVLNSLDANIKCGNSLIKDPAYTDKPFVWQENFAEIFTESNNSGFDVVLGNPPYVRQELISPIKPYLEQHYKVYHGVADLYAYFFELGLNLLKPNGRMGYISSSTFFKTSSGKNLRQFLTAQASLENVVDFGDLQIFEGVTTYPAILTMRKAVPQTTHNFQTLVLGTEVPTDLTKYFKEHATPMTQANLDVAAWRLESDELLNLRHKITTDKPILKEIYGSPYRGILTGLNEAFVIDQATKDELIKADPKSTELLKPFLEGKDLHKWHSASRNLFLILIPKGWTRQSIDTPNENEAWQWFCDTYPAISQHLLPFAEKAKKRTDKGEFWWELRACAYYDNYERNKIVYIEIADHPKFVLDNSQTYLNATAFMLNTGDLFLLGLFNSNLYWFFWLGICTFLRGGFLRLKAQFLDLSPIPSSTEDQKQAIAQLAEKCQATAELRYQKQEAVRCRIPDLCPQNREAKLTTKLKNWWQLDFSQFRSEIKKVFKQDIPLQERNDWEQWLKQEQTEITKLTAQLDTLEQKLNTLVYELFALTPEEIKLIEKFV